MRPVVLVVDDDAATRWLIVDLLDEAGLKGVPVSNPGRAMLLLDAITPAMIVCGAMLPGMHGVDFIHMLSRQDRFAQVPIIVLTATRLTAKLPPTATELAKPFDIDRFTEIIIARLEQAPTRSERSGPDC